MNDKLIKAMKHKFKAIVGADTGTDNNYFSVSLGASSTEEAIELLEKELKTFHAVWQVLLYNESGLIAEIGEESSWWHSRLPERECTCGSGQFWAFCSENSSYCG